MESTIVSVYWRGKKENEGKYYKQVRIIKVNHHGNKKDGGFKEKDIWRLLEK